MAEHQPLEWCLIEYTVDALHNGRPVSLDQQEFVQNGFAGSKNLSADPFDGYVGLCTVGKIQIVVHLNLLSHV